MRWSGVVLTLLAASVAPLPASAGNPEDIEVDIVAPANHPGYRPVFPESTLRDVLVRFTGAACDPGAIEETLSPRYRFLGYVPTFEISCTGNGPRLRVRESSHTVDLITFDAAELARIGVEPNPDYEEKRTFYPVPADAPRALLRSLLLTREGDLYNSERYRVDREALQKIGYMVVFIPGEQQDSAVYPSGAYLIQSLTPHAPGTEEPRRKTNYLGGTGSYAPRQKGSVGLLYEKDSLISDLDRLTFAPTYNAGAGGDLAYLAPVLASREKPQRLYDVDLRLFSEFQLDRLLEGVETDERQTGYSVTLGARPLRLAAPHSLRLQIGFRRERVSLAEKPLGEEGGDSDRVLLGATYEWRHTYRWPSLSARLEPGVEWVVGATGGERTFMRPTLDGSFHGRFPTGLEIDLHFHGGTIDQRVPSYELLSLGGPTTVRGFREDSFLGRDLASLQAELWLPFARPIFNGPPAAPGEEPDLARTPVETRAARLFKLALFVDGGYLSRTTTGATDSIAGAGFGIRFMVPHRPLVIRADYGRGLGSHGGDWVPYVTLGVRY